jgi:GT2 family glycosyltransferase
MTEYNNPLEPKDRPVLEIPLIGSNDQVSIIVVHHERPEFLNICLQSIRIMSNLNNYEIIVVDNASKDDQTPDFLNALEEEGVKVVRNKENLYWSAAANKGVSKADKNSKYFIFMHCDTVVLNQSWIDILINVSNTNECGIVGTEMPKYTINKSPSGFVAEWCMLITRDCWDDCGPWPEQLPIVGPAFVLTWKAQSKGYKPQIISNLIVHHYKTFSFKTPKEFNEAVLASYTIIPKLLHN